MQFISNNSYILCTTEQYSSPEAQYWFLCDVVSGEGFIDLEFAGQRLYGEHKCEAKKMDPDERTELKFTKVTSSKKPLFIRADFLALLSLSKTRQ